MPTPTQWNALTSDSFCYIQEVVGLLAGTWEKRGRVRHSEFIPFKTIGPLLQEFGIYTVQNNRFITPYFYSFFFEPAYQRQLVWEWIWEWLFKSGYSKTTHGDTVMDPILHYHSISRSCTSYLVWKNMQLFPTSGPWDSCALQSYKPFSHVLFFYSVI